MKLRHKSVFLLVTALSASAVLAQAASAPLEEAQGAAVAKLGYASVAEALESLKEKPGTTISVTKPDGWVIVTEPKPYSVWSFTPAGHYAHPAVVRRVIQQSKEGNVSIEMAALCQAEKDLCDKLVREFQEMNEQMKQQVRRRIEQGNKAP